MCVYCKEEDTTSKDRLLICDNTKLRNNCGHK